MRPVPGMLALAPLLTGCLGPVALHRAVLDYDESVSRIAREMLNNPPGSASARARPRTPR